MAGNNLNLKSILEIDDGSIQTRADEELEKIIANINDLKTPALAVRKLTIEIVIKPTSEERTHLAVVHTVKSKLAPFEPKTAMLVNTEETLELTGERVSVLKEVTTGIAKGQINLDGMVNEPAVYVIGANYNKALRQQAELGTVIDAVVEEKTAISEEGEK